VSRSGCDYMVSFRDRNTCRRSWIGHDGQGSDLGNEGDRVLSLEVCELMNDPYKSVKIIKIMKVYITSVQRQ